jgi:hypothetical protein
MACINSWMRISEIVTPGEQSRINSLDRNAKMAAFSLKQERYRQRLKSYSERMRKVKPGSKPPKRPEPPKPPSTSS